MRGEGEGSNTTMQFTVKKLEFCVLRSNIVSSYTHRSLCTNAGNWTGRLPAYCTFYFSGQCLSVCTGDCHLPELSRMQA